MPGLKKYFAVAALSLSAVGMSFIQGWEGNERTAYRDVVGVNTICSGSTRGVYLGMQASPAECEERLVQDTQYAGQAIRSCVTAKLTQDQYDAVLSLGFNIGGGALCRSTLVKKLNRGDCVGAGAEFLRWDRAGGSRLRGLHNRRVAERALFIKDCNVSK